MRICGIYKITNLINGKIIIGFSAHIKRRWRLYEHKLNKNTYPNIFLQEDWNKYKKENFKFEIILECEKSQLREEETRLIKQYNSSDKTIGYNIKKGKQPSIPKQHLPRT